MALFEGPDFSMTGTLKQARNLSLFLLAALACPAAALAGVLTTSGAVKTGVESPARDSVVSVDSVLEGLSGTVESLIQTMDSLPVPSLSDGKASETGEKPKAADPPPNEDAIKAKRLDQDQTKKQAPASVKDAPPAPYKVYAAPMIADDPPVGEEEPLPALSRTSRPETAPESDSFQAWDAAKARTIDFKKPPPLPDNAVAPAAPAKARGVPPTAALPKQFFPIVPLGVISHNALQLLPVASSRPLGERDKETTRAIVYVHDMTRNAAEGIATLMTLAGEEADATLIVAPQFPLDIDIARFAKHLPDSGRRVARWRVDDGWQWGGESVLAEGRQKGISSFAAMDILLMYLADRERLPRLTQIVVAGHGHGGDFVQRYAAAGRAPVVLGKEGFPLRFVAADAGSYLYMTASRFSSAAGRFGPADNAACPDVNAYPYGLEGLNPYVKAIGASALRLGYPEKRIVYLTGDKVLIDNYIDRSCAAMAQGEGRTERARNYSRYLEKSFGSTAADHKVVIIPNAGYDPVALFGSSCGMSALFGDGPC